MNALTTIQERQQGRDMVLQQADMLSKSSIVPKEYQSNPSNCVIAIEMSNRIGVSPMAVMQNLHIIHGRPSWSSTFIISSINSSGRFKTNLQFEKKTIGKKEVTYFTTEWQGREKSRKEHKITIEDASCMAYATDKDGNRVDGPTVTISMAVKEGWYTKTDSKWQTMPEVMLMYRSAAFFGRMYCPEILMGMHTEDEIIDITPAPVAKQPVGENGEKLNSADRLAAMLKEEVIDVTEPETAKPEGPALPAYEFKRIDVPRIRDAEGNPALDWDTWYTQVTEFIDTEVPKAIFRHEVKNWMDEHKDITDLGFSAPGTNAEKVCQTVRDRMSGIYRTKK